MYLEAEMGELGMRLANAGPTLTKKAIKWVCNQVIICECFIIMNYHTSGNTTFTFVQNTLDYTPRLLHIIPVAMK